MAHVPRRPAERRLRRRLLPLLVLAFAARGAAQPATSQEPREGAPSREESPRVGAHVEVGGGLTFLLGDATPVLDVAALLALSPGVAVGGGGTVFPSGHDVEGDLVFPDQTLGFGYGGILVEAELPPGYAGTDMAIRTLLGAGNAHLEDGRTGARLASDNVLVLEPELVLRRSAASRLDLGVSLSWRAVLGLDDVEGVDPGDLSTLSLGLHLRVGPL